MKKAVAVLIAVVAAGCGPKSLSEMSYSERQALVDEIIKTCAAQGYGPGSTQHDACLMHEAKREADYRVNSSAALRATGAAMAAAAQGYGNAMRQQTYSQPTTCTSRPFSGNLGGPVSSVTTTCY